MQPMAQHEAIELRLGQFECATLLDRILRGNHQKRRRQAKTFLADRHAALLHGFEQGTLHLGAARLISSASSRLVKIGPFTVRKSLVR